VVDATVKPASAAAVVGRLTSPILVGRDDELSLLLEAATSPPAFAAVEGEAGVGKTRLVEELMARPELQDRGRHVGRCHQLSEPFLLGPVVDAVRGAAPAPRPFTAVVGALRPLLPELADRLPPPPDPLGDPRAERHRLFRAVRELLHALGPSVLVLEDVHWADQATVELVRFLVPQLPPNLTLVCTYRREDLADRSPLPGLAGHLPSGARGVRVTLPPLDRGQLHALVATILDVEDVSREFADCLLESSGGLPFAVEEILKLLEDRKDLVHRNRVWVRRRLEEIEVPAVLQDSLLERLGRLSPDAQEVVRAAAVLGTPGAEHIVLGVAARPAERGARALADALSAAMLVESSRGLYGFRHALARQAVENAIPSPVRQRLHLRAARALEGVRPKPLARLAHHYRAGGDAKRWVRYAEAAAEHAAAMHDDATAYGLLKEALAVPGLPPSARARLGSKLAIHAIYSLNHEEAIAVLRHLVGDGTLPRGLRGEVRFSLGTLLLEAGELACSYAEIARSVDELVRRPDLQARSMAHLAQPWASADVRVEEHLRWLDQAVRAAAGSNDPEVRTKVAVDRAVTLLAFGDPRCWEAVEEIPRPGAGAGEMRQAVRACNNVADAMLHLGHYRRAEEVIREGLRVAGVASYARGATALHITWVELDWVLGNWDGLRDRARSSADEAEDWAIFRGDVETVLGLVLLAQGEVRPALRRLDALARQRSTTPAFLPWAAGGVARIRLAQGKPDAALNATAGALDIVQRKGVWNWATDVAPAAVEALLAADRRADATRLRHEFAEGLQRRGAPAASAALAVCDALLMDDDGAAEAHLAAEQAWLALPRPYEAAMARERAGRCLLVAGAERGPELLVEAMDAFRALGAAWDAARVRRTLQAHGVIPPNRRGRRGYGGELSPREAQVAELAAAGLNNGDIGLALFLSRKTVEKHLTSAMRKLDVSARTELPGALAPMVAHR
jgi:DNA-binding NarL/FixJ family response regulator